MWYVTVLHVVVGTFVNVQEVHLVCSKKKIGIEVGKLIRHFVNPLRKHGMIHNNSL